MHPNRLHTIKQLNATEEILFKRLSEKMKSLHMPQQRVRRRIKSISLVKGKYPDDLGNDNREQK